VFLGISVSDEWREFNSIWLRCGRRRNCYTRGGLVAFPTETVYGLGADATNPIAVAKIFAAKQRPRFDPLIVHVGSVEDARQLVRSFPEPAFALAEQFWPGPLTMVLPRLPVVPDLVTAGLPGVGLRIPCHPVALELLRQSGKPLAAPSANPFSGISPTRAQHVADGLGDRVDMILDGGPCEVGLESTVVSFMTGIPTLLRPGGCQVEAIERVIGPLDRPDENAAAEALPQQAPGMLSRHYAPATRLVLVEYDDMARPLEGQRCGVLTEATRAVAAGFSARRDLSATGDLVECAAGFFDALRQLDSAGLDAIFAHRFPDRGLGIALNDRLRRAAC
jgi:L-threonylcarbamoyladenylate synthase